MSRLDMALAVAGVCGFPTSNIVAAPASSVNRPARSPADISMDSSRLEGDLGMRLTAFPDALKQMHQAGALEPPYPERNQSEHGLIRPCDCSRHLMDSRRVEREIETNMTAS